jgi:ribose transport system substrate-binding protein
MKQSWRKGRQRGLQLLLAAAALAAIVLVVTGCGSGKPSTDSESHSGPYKIALSMSYVGNDWQNEAENLVKAVAASPEYKDKVDLRVDIAGTSVPKQIQQINSEVAAGMDAIVAYPISPTALNVAIRNACKQGVIVYAYNANVTEPCAYNVKTSDVQFGYEQGKWLCEELDGQGEIAEITGVPGTSADTDRKNGLAEGLKKCPGVTVAASANGMWDQATTKQVFSSIYTAHPNIDGVSAQVGCLAVAEYLLSQNKPLIPCAGEASQGHRLLMLPKKEGGEDFRSISVSGPAYTGELALMNSVKILEGKKMQQNMLVPLPLVTNETIKAGTNVAKGANVYPVSAGVSVPPGFFDSFYSPLVTQGLRAALSGLPDTVSKPKECSEVPGCKESDSVEVFHQLTGPTVPY